MNERKEDAREAGTFAGEDGKHERYIVSVDNYNTGNDKTQMKIMRIFAIFLEIAAAVIGFLKFGWAVGLLVLLAESATAIRMAIEHKADMDEFFAEIVETLKEEIEKNEQD